MTRLRSTVASMVRCECNEYVRCEWIKSERYQKRVKEDAKRREQNNPMKVCVLKYDHFENIHRLDPKLPTQEGAPNFRQVEQFKSLI